MAGPDVLPTFDDVLIAARRIAGVVHRTPVVTCAGLDALTGAKLFLKCENLQKVGAFKYRGATNAVVSLTSEQASRGVATHSSGNHAAALALAAAHRGIPATIVMPSNAPEVKKAAVRGYGAKIVFCEPTLEARERSLERVVRDTGAAFVHPYDDARVIAGQGTAALELLEDVPELDVVMAPVGGGGLLSGTTLTVRAISPTTRILAGEPAGADDAFRSLQEGRIVPSIAPRTIADGLLTSLGTLTFPVIKSGVERIVTVGEQAIVTATRHVLERAKLVIEPSAAVPIAVLLEGKVDLRGLRIGIILSGGNLDLDNPPWGAGTTGRGDP